MMTLSMCGTSIAELYVIKNDDKTVDKPFGTPFADKDGLSFHPGFTVVLNYLYVDHKNNHKEPESTGLGKISSIV